MFEYALGVSPHHSLPPRACAVFVWRVSSVDGQHLTVPLARLVSRTLTGAAYAQPVLYYVYMHSPPKQLYRTVATHSLTESLEPTERLGEQICAFGG